MVPLNRLQVGVRITNLVRGSRGLRGRLFEGEEAVLHVIELIVAPFGLRVDKSSNGWMLECRTVAG
jgi:hypothetical protein